MDILKVFRALGPVDVRSILRDSLLRWMLIIPLLPAMIVRWGIPELTDWLVKAYSFDLVPYYSLIMSFFVLFIPTLVGVVIGFVLLDERDDRTLTALRVTPLQITDYLAYRISAPVIVSILLTMVAFPIAGLVTVPTLPLLAITIMASIEAPIFALLLAVFARNKVVGLALYKGFSIFYFAPLAVFFIQTKWQLLAGLFPTYWPVKTFWLAVSGNADWIVYLLAGFAMHGLVLWLLLKQFQKIQLD